MQSSPWSIYVRRTFQKYSLGVFLVTESEGSIQYFPQHLCWLMFFLYNIVQYDRVITWQSVFSSRHLDFFVIRYLIFISSFVNEHFGSFYVVKQQLHWNCLHLETIYHINIISWNQQLQLLHDVTVRYYCKWPFIKTSDFPQNQLIREATKKIGEI